MALNEVANTPGMKRDRSAEPLRSAKRHSPTSPASPVRVTRETARTGQTAPRLIHTIKTADRRNRILQERNPYTDPPRGLDERFDDTRRNPLSTPCRHEWTLQEGQNELPESDADGAHAENAYKLGAFCQNCWWHLSLQIQHTAQPCPKPGFPFHHFTDFQRDSDDHEWYHARCSGCAANVRIDYREPKLMDIWVDLLTSEDKLRDRLECAKRNDPDRGHAAPARPLEVLDALSTYLVDSLIPSETPKRIPKLNRRFVISFGDDCDEVLFFLGFRNDGDFWTLPQPDNVDPWSWNSRTLIEDALEELRALMRYTKAVTNSNFELEGKKGYKAKPDSADPAMQLFFSTWTYERQRPRRPPTLSSEEQLWYAALGALGDFSDDHISFAFDRQVATNKSDTPFYYDCLTSIAEKRGSSDLDLKVAMLASEGFYGREEVVNAYKYFMLDYRKAHELHDDYIRGVFESRLGSVSEREMLEAREKLRMIGLSRNSQALLNVAQNDVVDWKSALRWLDPQFNEANNYDDGYVIALATAKKAETTDEDTRQNVEKAVQLIADHRNSDALKAYLSTGEAAAISEEDEVSAAYRFFDIKDRTQPIDTAVLQTQLILLETDEDSKTFGKDEAKITRAREYFDILVKQQPEIQMAPTDYTQPVGIRNEANYCYLNAVIQYYYSLAPFRETVFNFDEYRQPLDQIGDANLGNVGAARITTTNVEEGQALMEYLRDQFIALRRSQESTVRPDPNFAREAIKPTSARRRMTLSGNRRESLLNPQALAAAGHVSLEVPKNASAGSPSSQTAQNDAASDITLIGDGEPVMTPEESDNEADIAQNGRIDLKRSESDGGDSAIDFSIGDGKENEGDDTVNPQVPDRPPPVPPRPQQRFLKDHYLNEPDIGAPDFSQWDSSEVMGFIMEKAAASLKPSYVGPNGERSDRIQDDFFPWFQDHVLGKGESAEPVRPRPDLFFRINYHRRPRDVMDGLELELAREPVKLEDNPNMTAKYSTICKLPPIIQVYMQNRGFDRESQKDFIVDHYMPLQDTIYVDRLLETSREAVLPLREELWDAREQMKALADQKAGYKVDGDLNLDSAQGFDALGDLINATSDEKDEEAREIRSTLQAQADRDRKCLAEIDEEISKLNAKIDVLNFDQFNTQQNKYTLFAVFVKTGMSAAGHWYIYIRDFTANLWRCYNDTHVTVVPDSDVLKKRGPTEGHVQLAMYVQDAKKETYVQPVCREKPEVLDGVPKALATTDADGDVEMGGMKGRRDSVGLAHGRNREGAPEPESAQVRDVEMKPVGSGTA